MASNVNQHLFKNIRPFSSKSKEDKEKFREREIYVSTPPDQNLDHIGSIIEHSHSLNRGSWALN